MPTSNETDFQLAQLRHLYTMMVNGQVTDTKQAAEGLLSPAIATFERLLHPKAVPMAPVSRKAVKLASADHVLIEGFAPKQITSVQEGLAYWAETCRDEGWTRDTAPTCTLTFDKVTYILCYFGHLWLNGKDVTPKASL
jgi:hypothetical protein